MNGNSQPLQTPTEQLNIPADPTLLQALRQMFQKHVQSCAPAPTSIGSQNVFISTASDTQTSTFERPLLTKLPPENSLSNFEDISPVETSLDASSDVPTNDVPTI